MIHIALTNLRPGCSFRVDDTYSSIVWLDDKFTKPTQQEVDDEIKRIRSYELATEYQRKRAAEYPPITDYLDAVVKNDTEQMQAYIDACLAVKAKYPKPE